MDNNKKQTAVERLEKELKERYPLINSEPLFDQAKEIEKEQIMDARMDGINSALKGYAIGNEEYYNETYKSE
jgi:hypothetical protein